MGRAAAVLYELGALLVEVEERSLWRAGGWASFTEYLEQSLDVSGTTARRAMTVARHFNQGMVERYGMEKLSAGLRYLELTSATEQPGDLVAAKLRLRGESGRFETVGFHEASSRQVRQAIRVLETTRQSGVPEDERHKVERLSKGIAELGGGAVKAKRRRDGGISLSFKGVPLERLAELAEVLRGL